MADAVLRPRGRSAALAPGLRLGLGLGACLWGLGACGGGGGGGPAAPTPGRPVQPLGTEDRLYYDARSPIADSTAYVIRDAARLAEEWDRLTEGRRSKPPLPSVDFARHIVTVSAAGPVPAGDRIRVDSAAVREVRDTSGRVSDALVVYETLVRECSALSDSRDTPVEVVRILRFDGPVQFRRTAVQGAGC